MDKTNEKHQKSPEEFYLQGFFVHSDSYFLFRLFSDFTTGINTSAPDINSINITGPSRRSAPTITK